MHWRSSESRESERKGEEWKGVGGAEWRDEEKKKKDRREKGKEVGRERERQRVRTRYDMG
jgi:hypothetical protein